VNGSVTIRGNLTVTGTEVVDGDSTARGDLGVVGRAFLQTAVYGTGTSVPCAFPAGAVGGTTTPDARTLLPLPRGFRISADGANFVDVTASASGGGEHQVNIANGLVTGGSCFLGQNGGFVQIGTATAQGALILPPGPGQGTLASPVNIAPLGAFYMTGNKCFIRVTSAGSINVFMANPDFVPSAWCFTNNTQPIQNYFTTSGSGVITLTAVGGAQTFGVLAL